MAAKYPLVSKYQGGFANGVEILGMPILNSYAGRVYWVSATDGSDQNKGTRDRPFATLSKAVTSCASNGGDVVMLAPNHKETIADALSLDATGMTIQGMGSGGQRPRFLFSGGAATDGFDVPVADVTIDNVLMIAGFKDMVSGFDVDATDCTINNVEFRDNAVTQNWSNAIQSGVAGTDNECDGLTVTNCVALSATDSHNSFINQIGDLARGTVSGNVYIAEPAVGLTGQFIAGTSGDDIKNMLILDNYVVVTQTATATYFFIAGTGETDHTGIIARNLVGHHLSNTSVSNNYFTQGTGFRYMENYNVGSDVGGGNLHPTATET